MKICIEGYVAFLDILGFSRIVANDSFHERFESYIEIIRTAVNFPGSNLEFEITSDSVVILFKRTQYISFTTSPICNFNYFISFTN